MNDKELAGTETISKKPPVTGQNNYRHRHLSGMAPKGKKKWVPRQFSSKGKV
jgi:hypothetical protein